MTETNAACSRRVLSTTPTTPASTRDRAFVKMFEIVDASSWTTCGKGIMEIDDLRPLLWMMDIGSCASAEKHTSVNCVTASMGDLVIEHYPKIGELLELHASPVDTGTTSLNIAVTVYAHGGVDNDNDDEEEESSSSSSSNNSSSSSSNNSDEDGSMEEDKDEPKPAQTKRVCEAFFTYVTTRGPNGEKRFVPPLDSGCRSEDDSSDWERTMARFRKQLIRSEQQSSTLRPKDHTILLQKAIFESSEVVLPSHQNHMGHLFGGIVMGWMCKSALAACVKATRLPMKKFRIRSVQRVDFPTGAEVSDHVFFRPRITAVFDGGRSAEIEVMVGKRTTTTKGSDDAANTVTTTSANKQEETTINFGYFYVSGMISATTNTNNNTNTNTNTNKRLSTSVAPFAGLIPSKSSTKRTSQLLQQLCREQQNRVSGQDEITAMAHQRRAHMLARRFLLAGIGEPILWDPLLEVQAPILTILSVLRLNNEYQKSIRSSVSSSDETYNTNGPSSSSWNPIRDGDQEEPVWWSYGNSWGNHNTLLIFHKRIISRKKSSSSSSSSSRNNTTLLQDCYRTLCSNRARWDPFTLNVRVLEQTNKIDTEQTDSKHQNSVFWDVADYEMKASETAHTTFCLLRAGSYIGADGSLNSNDERTTIPTSGVLASRSVRHEGSFSTNRVLPSGFLLKALDLKDGSNEENEFLEINYVAEVREECNGNYKWKKLSNASTNNIFACVCVVSNVVTFFLSISHVLRLEIPRTYFSVYQTVAMDEGSTISTLFAARVRLEPKQCRTITSCAFLRRIRGHYCLL